VGWLWELEQGVWGRNLVKVSPQLAQPNQTQVVKRRPLARPGDSLR
jgi:hypothetical protein